MERTYSAGDLGRYAYCSVSWDLHRNGSNPETPQTRAGHAHHGRLERRLPFLKRLGRHAHEHATNSVFFSCLGALVLLEAYAFAKLFQARDPWNLFVLVSLIGGLMVFAAAFYYWSSALAERQELRTATQAFLPPGRLVWAGDAEPEPLSSPLLPLRGSPDAVVKTPNGLVPVEAKTNPCPPMGPPASHVIQAQAYIVLVEDALGSPPTHAVLTYPDGHRNVTGIGARDAVARALLRLKAHDELAAPVQRNHYDRGRCLGCRYRTGCPQNLA